MVILDVDRGRGGGGGAGETSVAWIESLTVGGGVHQLLG